jgi:uncharacterized protein
MATFKLHTVSATTGDKKIFYYDNEFSTLVDENGENIINQENKKQFNDWIAISKDKPGIKTSPKIIKIQMGLSCNYSCFYCSQRFVPHAEETNKNNIEKFMKDLPKWFSSNDGTDCSIEFWGGEPFVYWKTMQPLAEELKQKYPNAKMSVITNGSLLDTEKNIWLDEMDFAVAISHDGPGQIIRGPNPLDDEENKKSILDLYNRLRPKNKITINAMVNKNNINREAIHDYLKEFFGEDVPIGEGGFIDPYDEGGMQSCFETQEEHINYRNNYLIEIRNGKVKNFVNIMQKINDFYHSICDNRPSKSLGQKCGMDNPENISVDLKGNVLTCQNVSSVAKSMNGENHKIGHVNDLENVKLNTATHFSNRKECLDCPVLQLCKGSCMFLENEFWEKGCDSSFSDNIPLFASVIEAITGYLPVYIDGPQREERKNIFWSL